MARTPINQQSIRPRARASVGVNSFVQAVPDPNAGKGLQRLSQALGVAGNIYADRQQEANDEYENNVNYYANQFAQDRELGLVDATQVGAAFPDASPIVRGKITEIVGSRWANQMVRSRFDEFLQDDSVRLDPNARNEFFQSVRDDIASEVGGRPFFGQGAITTADSIIREYESNLQRETTQYNTTLQEESFTGEVQQALQFEGMSQTALDDPTVPAGLLGFIGQAESNGNYNAYYGNGNNTSTDFTRMSVDEVISWQRRFLSQGSPSSAVGKYQFLLKTLRGLKTEMGLSGSEKFSPELQDQLANQLLKDRGYDDYQNGSISAEEFANNLSQEWAALPLVSGDRAGESFYQGDGLNSARVGTSALMAAVSDPHSGVGAIAVVDQLAGDTTSINPIRRREIIVDTAIQTAIANRDTSVLDRIPESMASVPEVGSKIEAARTQVNNLAWNDYTRQQRLATDAQAASLLEGKVGILQAATEGETVDPTQFRDNPELFNFAMDMRDAELVDPVFSSDQAANIRQRIIQGSTTGQLAPLFNNNGNYDLNSMGGLRNAIANSDELNASDKIALMDELPTLLEGYNFLNNPEIDDFFGERISTDVQAYMDSIQSVGDTIVGNNVAGDVRRAFDQTLRSLILAEIEDNGAVPRGRAKYDILKEAETAALDRLRTIREGSSFAATNQPEETPSGSSQETEIETSEEDEALLQQYLSETEEDEPERMEVSQAGYDDAEGILSRYARGELTAAQAQRELNKFGLKANLRGNSNEIDVWPLDTGHTFTVAI